MYRAWAEDCDHIVVSELEPQRFAALEHGTVDYLVDHDIEKIWYIRTLHPRAFGSGPTRDVALAAWRSQLEQVARALPFLCAWGKKTQEILALQQKTREGMAEQAKPRITISDTLRRVRGLAEWIPAEPPTDNFFGVDRRPSLPSQGFVLGYERALYREES